MEKKNAFLIKLVLSAVIVMAFFGFVKVTAATEQEKVVSTNTVVQWTSKPIDYNMPLTDCSIVFTTAGYKVEHYQETTTGNYTLVDTEADSGIVGDTGIYTPNTYDGYVYDSDLTTPSNKTITKDGNLVIKLYYNKRTDLSYTVNHYYEGNPDLAQSITYNNQTFGNKITNADITLIVKDGYVYGKTDNTPLSITTDESKNVIDIYYYESNLKFTKTSTAYNAADGSKIPDTTQFIHEGDTITYTITAKNSGLGVEKNITITDHINLNVLNYVDTIPTGGGQATTSIDNDANTLELTWNRRY